MYIILAQSRKASVLLLSAGNSIGVRLMQLNAEWFWRFRAPGGFDRLRLTESKLNRFKF